MRQGLAWSRLNLLSYGKLDVNFFSLHDMQYINDKITWWFWKLLPTLSFNLKMLILIALIDVSTADRWFYLFCPVILEFKLTSHLFFFFFHFLKMLFKFLYFFVYMRLGFREGLSKKSYQVWNQIYLFFVSYFPSTVTIIMICQCSCFSI